MAGIDAQNRDSLQPLIDRLENIERQIRTSQQPTGTSVGSLVQQVQTALIGITATVNAKVTDFLSGGFSTGGNVSVTGNVTATGTVTGTSGVKSVGVYNELLTGGGSYKVQYIHEDGRMGYVPSSRQFKQDIETKTIDFDTLRQLRVVSFRYTAAVQNLGDAASVEVGLIAEEVHALGVTWLVDYDNKGKPFGIRYERLALVSLMWCNYLDAKLESLNIL